MYLVHLIKTTEQPNNQPNKCKIYTKKVVFANGYNKCKKHTYSHLSPQKKITPRHPIFCQNLRPKSHFILLQ